MSSVEFGSALLSGVVVLAISRNDSMTVNALLPSIQWTMVLGCFNRICFAHSSASLDFLNNVSLPLYIALNSLLLVKELRDPTLRAGPWKDDLHHTSGKKSVHCFDQMKLDSPDARNSH